MILKNHHQQRDAGSKKIPRLQFLELLFPIKKYQHLSRNTELITVLLLWSQYLNSGHLISVSVVILEMIAPLVRLEDL